MMTIAGHHKTKCE